MISSLLCCGTFIFSFHYKTKTVFFQVALNHLLLWGAQQSWWSLLCHLFLSTLHLPPITSLSKDNKGRYPVSPVNIKFSLSQTQKHLKVNNLSCCLLYFTYRCKLHTLHFDMGISKRSQTLQPHLVRITMPINAAFAAHWCSFYWCLKSYSCMSVSVGFHLKV